MRQRIRELAFRGFEQARRAIPALWREPMVRLPVVARGMQFPLHPSRIARHVTLGLAGISVLYVAQLLVLGHAGVAAGTGLLVAASGWLSRRRFTAAGSTARRLMLGADGRIHLLDAGGRLLPVVLHPSSMRLGPWLLLVLHEGGRVHRLLLGPDNLDAGQLAALRRRLAAIAQRTGGTR